MLLRIHRQNKPLVNGKVYLSFIFALYYNRTKAIPHNSKCRYGERDAAAAKPKAQIILDAAKVSAASGGCSEPKQGQRSQSARGFCPEARCGYRNPTLSSILATQMPCRTPSRSEALRSATAACGGSWRGDPPERCLSRKAGIMRCCLSKLFTLCLYAFAVKVYSPLPSTFSSPLGSTAVHSVPTGTATVIVISPSAIFHAALITP